MRGSRCALFLSLVLFGCQPQTAGPTAAPRQAAVATYDDEATREAMAVLEEGGTACDAYVAATWVLYVRAAGETSLAGPMSALWFDAKTGGVDFLDASFNAPLDATPSANPVGQGILVPGAPAGLTALHARHCTLPMERLTRRAIALARDGFPISALYAATIAYRMDLLERSEYGQRTFFKEGAPLKAGDVLRQPELADLLEAITASGDEVIYRGSWAAAFLDAAKAVESPVTSADLTAYRAAWRVPHHVTYRGRTVYANSGRTMGGLHVLLALKVLENAKLPPAEHPSASADALEVLLRVWRATSEEYWLYDPATLDDAEAVASRLSDANVARLWKNVVDRLSAPAKTYLGHHSQTVTVIDPDGNAITGINTIQSYPWGDGVFVHGVALPNAGRLASPGAPGSRKLDTAALNVSTRDGALEGLGATFSFSLREAAFQMWVNLIDYGMPVDRALAEPRFGTFVISADVGSVDMDTQYLDPAVPSGVAAELMARGLGVTQTAPAGSFLDLGLGTAATTDGAAPKSALMPTH